MNSKDKKRVDLDVRPEGPWFSNYDYAGPDEPTEISPGKGLYNGKMDRYKSVRDFIEMKRKRKCELKNATYTPDQLLKAATRFSELVAQQGFGMQTTADPMKKALDQKIGKQVQALVTDAFQKSMSSVQINIDFNPETKTAKFVLYGNGSDEDKAALTNGLNQLGPTAFAIMSKYQKTPFDYKYAEFSR
ncbi:hypothetical protein E6Q11_02950 [Candidatus Dojkabacteria bacterium]|uniref:Uncharacterized protein n=1 Tax=Candidatus Dojkabacteria bacterium TaxID=2099670 RepID=A0A5C7J6Z3_9BACT|nr:MAG: hypothetical protein E6Q11_02950 [Candidatus Dojkabacteria bacterium]